jgi:hypothetical protein
MSLFGTTGASLVTRLAKASDDGYDVEVYEIRMPARFYKIVALPGPNGVGRARPGFVLETGSDMGDLAMTLAHAITEGMLDATVPNVAPEIGFY